MQESALIDNQSFGLQGLGFWSDVIGVRYLHSVKIHERPVSELPDSWLCFSPRKAEHGYNMIVAREAWWRHNVQLRGLV
jgi:hypothetical protein